MSRHDAVLGGRPVNDRINPRLVTAAAAVAALVTAVACTSSSGGTAVSSAAPSTTSSSVAPSTSTTTSTVTSTATPTSRPTASATPSSPAPRSALTDCAENQLRASLDPRPVTGTSANGKYTAVIVDFQNTSDRACLLHGYPGAALVDSSGTQVKQATRTVRGALLGVPPGRDGEPTVTLPPGAFASAGLEGVNHQEQGAAQAGCDASYPRMLITPPNTTIAVPFNHAWPVCYSFDVHPVNVEKNPPG